MAGLAQDFDAATQGLDVYVVGGAVRDALLDLPAGDRDWVVVGATPEAMAARRFIPVGGDFPVFLHPQTKEEYALARTERKSGRGYQGFTFYTGVDVTLEEDLKRRDLTVNAIARAPDGRLIDPLDGQADVQAKILRHVGDAFVEDPVRLLRLARFAARFHDFTIAPETMGLARRLVDEGEVDALVPERVWREVTKGLDAAQPGRMFEVLQTTGALARVMPGLVFNDEIARQLACAVSRGLGLAGRFALLCRLSKQPEQVGRDVRASSECIDYARLLPVVVAALPVAETSSTDVDASTGAKTNAGEGAAATPSAISARLDLIERCDGLRKPERFMDLLAAAACVDKVDAAIWRARLDAVRSVDAGAIAKAQQGRPEQIKAALKEARLQALSNLG